LPLIWSLYCCFCDHAFFFFLLFAGGFVEWDKGDENGKLSCAEQLRGKKYWMQLCVITAVVSTERKEVSSTEGMRRSVATSPLYARWLEETGPHLMRMRSAIKKRAFDEVGQIAEASSDLMHEVAENAVPPVVYRSEKTRRIMAEVKRLRAEKNMSVYYSVDAGPQVKVLCLRKEMGRVNKILQQMPDVIYTIKNWIGSSAACVDFSLVDDAMLRNL